MERKLKVAFSGGGLRATFYALGAFRRLVELDLWKNVSRIDSVSGGSIAAGAIMAALKDGDFKDVKDFDNRVTEPMKKLGRLGLREMITRRWLILLLIICSAAFYVLTFRLHVHWIFSIPLTLLLLLFIFTKMTNIFSFLFEHYLNKFYFHNLTMNSLKDISSPEWSSNATCLNSGARFRFKPSDFGGHKIGVTTERNDIKVSFAVACSACFPPVFAPFKLKFEGRKFYFNWWKTAEEKQLNEKAPKAVYLTDGGVYDNLGSENIMKGTEPFIIYDAGGYSSLWEGNGNIFDPIFLWFKLLSKIIATALNQVTALRRRLIFAKSKEIGGCTLILGENTKAYLDFPASEKFGKLSATPNNDLPAYIIFDDEIEGMISNIRTDLDCFNDVEMELLMFMGEVKTDIVIKRYLPDWLTPNLLKDVPVKPQYSIEEIKEMLKNSCQIRPKILCK